MRLDCARLLRSYLLGQCCLQLLHLFLWLLLLIRPHRLIIAHLRCTWLRCGLRLLLQVLKPLRLRLQLSMILLGVHPLGLHQLSELLLLLLYLKHLLLPLPGSLLPLLPLVLFFLELLLELLVLFFDPG